MSTQRFELSLVRRSRADSPGWDQWSLQVDNQPALIGTYREGLNPGAAFRSLLEDKMAEVFDSAIDQAELR